MAIGADHSELIYLDGRTPLHLTYGSNVVSLNEIPPASVVFSFEVERADFTKQPSMLANEASLCSLYKLPIALLFLVTYFERISLKIV